MRKKKKSNEKNNVPFSEPSVQKSKMEVSKEEMLSEYFTFLRNIPVMPDLEKRKLIDLVKVEWNIDSILKSPIDPETN